MMSAVHSILMGNFTHRLACPKVTLHIVFLHIRCHGLPSILLVFENLAIDQRMSINDLVGYTPSKPVLYRDAFDTL